MGVLLKLQVLLLLFLLGALFVDGVYYPKKWNKIKGSNDVFSQNSYVKPFRSNVQPGEISAKLDDTEVDWHQRSKPKELLKPENLAAKPRLPKNLQVQQYWITTQPFFPAPGVDYQPSQNLTFDGYTKIRFNMLQDALNISVDATNLTFLNVSLWLNGTRQQLLGTQYDNNFNRLTITPVLFLKSNNIYELEFSYIGLVNNYTDGGLFFVQWNKTENNRPDNTTYILATQFEVICGARCVFPSFDDPSFKANFTVSLIYPTAFQALGNMPNSNASVVYGNGYSKVTFQTTPRMSTYLVAFSTGQFVNTTRIAQDGKPIGIWTWAGDSLNWTSRLDVAANTTVACYDALVNYLGVSYPLPKLDHLGLPKFAFGGMENWGLIIYAGDLILFHNQEDTTHERLLGISVRCHEMAHQWFGDLVTNEWWSEIMLHEALANYFELFAIGLMYNDQKSFSDSYYVASMQEYALQYAAVINHPVIDLPDGSFDDITYAKGGSLLRMLSGTVGATTFKNALNTYLTKYKYGNADHTQFFDVFTGWTKKNSIPDWCQTSYLNVSTYMDAWVTVPHFPSLTVGTNNAGNTYITGQETFLPLSYLPTGYNYSWYIPTKIFENGLDDGNWTWITPPSVVCPLTNPSLHQKDVQAVDKFNIYNDGAYTFARIRYEDEAHRKVRQFLKTGNNSESVSINTKIRLIADEWAYIDRDMVYLGLPPKLHRGLQILQAVLNDPSSVDVSTWRVAQPVIDTLLELSLDRHESDLYLKFLVPILTNFYNVIGWSGKENDFNTALLRAEMLQYAVRLNIGDARQVALQFWNNGNVSTLNPDLRRAVYCGAILNDDGTNFNVLLAMFLQIELTGYYTSRELNSIAQGLACAQNPQVITKVLDLFADRSSSGYRYNIHPAFSNFYHNPVASDVMADYLKNSSANNSTYYLFLDGFLCKKEGLTRCSLPWYLMGMTGLWYTDRRLEHFKQINSTVYQNLQSLGDIPNDYILDVINIFNDHYNQELLPANRRGAYTYSDMTRWMYDEYVPLGQIPWLKQLDETIVPDQYVVSVQPYFPGSYNYSIGKNFTYDGEVSIFARKVGPIQTVIMLNSHRQIIHHIRVFNQPPTGNLTELNYTSIVRDYDNATLTIHLGQPIPVNGNIQISIKYSGFIDKGPAEGTYVNWDYLEYNKQKSWIFATDFEGGPSTRSLVPCYDEPSKKAIWYVTVIYPTDMVAISNTLEESVINLGNGLSKTTFKPTEKMSSYLLAISVGDFAALRGLTKDGKLVRVWTWTGMQNNGELSLRAAIDTINFLTSNLNVTLPLEKLDVLALPQYTGYSAGAMENWGLIISGYLECLWHPDYSTTAQLTDTYWTTSHETTHQWFGDYVSPKWWNYIFLNEGFATYWPTTIMGETYRDQREWAEFYRFNDAETALRYDENIYSQAIVVPASQLQGYQVFGTQSYEKAGTILHMIEQTIHRKNFDLALTQYLNMYKLNTAVDTDLFEKFTEVAMADYPNIYDWNGNQLNVTKYITPYFYLKTFPLIKVVSSSDGLSYAYKQTPYLQSGLPNNTVFLWNIPLWTEPAQDYLPWLISQSSMNNPTTGWSVVNPRRKAYARVWYDDLTWAPIQAQIQSNLSVFDPITRASFIADTYTLANNGLVSWTRFLNLIKYAGSVSELPTWNILNHVFDNWLIMFKFQTTDYAKLQTFILQLLNNNSTLLFNYNGNWAHDLTADIFTRLSCYLGSSKCLGLSSTSFQQFIGNCQNSAYGTGKCNTIKPDFRLVQFCYGLRQNSGSANAVQNLVQWYITNAPLADYWRNDAMALLNSLSCLTSDTQVEQYLTYALNDQFPVEFFQSVGDSDPSGMRLFNYFKKNLATIVNSKHFNRIVSRLALGWSTTDQLNLLKNFDFQGLTLTSDQADAWNNVINGVQSNWNWLQQNQPVITKWLASNVS